MQQDLPLPCSPPPFPPCTQALEEPACLRGEGRKGTVEGEVPSSLWWGLVLPSPCQSGLVLGVGVPWGWRCAGPLLSPQFSSHWHTYWEAGQQCEPSVRSVLEGLLCSSSSLQM